MINEYDSKSNNFENIKNKRYKKFNHLVFTVGDEEQFESYSNISNGINSFVEESKLFSNVFKKDEIKTENTDSKIYNNLEYKDIFNTFKYMFNKFKKGIFVSIRNGKLNTFLPFSKQNFTNEWGKNIEIDKTKYKKLSDFMILSSSLSGYKITEKNINYDTEKWYANNFLLRSEYPVKESDTGIETLKNMFTQLCETRDVPDIDLFINRRDFPLLKKDLTEPYECLYDSKKQPLLSHKYERYFPILSMTVSDDFDDIPIPTFEDWKRVCSQEDKLKFEEGKDFNYEMNLDFSSKINKAVFRGSNTGRGTTIHTNTRLKVAEMSFRKPLDEDGTELLDAGITKWNTRPHKEFGEKYLSFTDTRKLNFGLVKSLSPSEQSNYKYIINIDGHVSAYRLSLELSMGSVVLLVDSEYRLWFRRFLVDGVHYISVKKDLSNLLERIKWCKRNQDKCIEIANNARKFYEKYLTKQSILDYLQLTLCNVKKNTGVYLCPFINIKDVIYERQKEILNKNVIEREKRDIKNINIMKSFCLSFELKEAFNSYIDKNLFNECIKSYEDDDNCDDECNQSYFKRHNIMKKNNSETFVLYNEVSNVKLLIKKTNDIDKIRDITHSYFIGKYCVNPLLKYIDNFSYTYSIFRNENEMFHIQEYIEGDSLYKWLEHLSLREFVSIFIQICLVLKYTQENTKFVHYDLYPWNIIIKKTDENILEFKLKDGVYKLKTNYKIYIIDFDRSTSMYQGIKYGIYNIFKNNYIQDVLCCLFSCLYTLLNKNLKNNELKDAFKLVNFISNTEFRKEKFKTVLEIKKFLNENKKMNEILYREKKGLEDKNPIDFVNYIIENDIKHNCSLEIFENNIIEDEYKEENGEERERDIEEYNIFNDIILSDNLDEIINIYENFFIKTFLNENENEEETYEDIYKQKEECKLIKSGKLQDIIKNFIIFSNNENFNALQQLKINRINDKFNYFITSLSSLSSLSKPNNMDNLCNLDSNVEIYNNFIYNVKDNNLDNLDKTIVFIINKQIEKENEMLEMLENKENKDKEKELIDKIKTNIKQLSSLTKC